MDRYNGPFWLATGERALFTFIEAYFGVVLVLGSFNAFEFDWLGGLGPALGATILAVVKGIIAANVNHSGSPSLANEAVVTTGRHAKPE